MMKSHCFIIQLNQILSFRISIKLSKILRKKKFLNVYHIFYGFLITLGMKTLLFECSHGQITQLMKIIFLRRGQIIQSRQIFQKLSMESAQNIKQKIIDSGIYITFKNVSYSVDIINKNDNQFFSFFTKTQKKQLINNISGIFKAGEVSVIMGASGAGKTSFLNLIAARVHQKRYQGQIRANDMYYDYKKFGDFANYVMQHDAFMQTLTVRETLMFAADLKMQATHQEKKEAVHQLANSLKLESCLDTIVGGRLIKGISGGQKKRTSIAFELISDPDVLILDEPTSGLDSLTSYVIVKHLSDLAHSRNKTIIMTIHQPNSHIFALFDMLFLMVQGKIIYQGPAKDATAYFAQNFGLECPEFHNPPDYFMSVIHNQTKQNVERYPEYYQAYDNNFAKHIEEQIQNRHKQPFQKRKVKVDWETTYCTLVRRDIRNIIRNPMMIKSRLFQTIVLTIFVGGLYCKFGPDYTNNNNWQALTGFFLFMSINSIFIALTPVTLIFPQERTVVLKEESAKLYGVTSYFMSRNTVEVPYALIFPMLQSLILYWFVGLSSTPQQFFIFSLIILLINFNGMSLGLLLGSVVHDMKSVSTITPALLLPLLVFSGFFKNRNNIPDWIGWIQYISPFKYGFSAFVFNEVQQKSNIGLWGSIGLLAIIGLFLRLLSWYFLWRLRKRIQQ